MDFKDEKQKNPCEQTEEQETLNDEELEQVSGGELPDPYIRSINMNEKTF
ncbi:MAG: bacteriocin [Clostridia bacterium]|nr:bacteriocin [Clostridia bacterium]